MKIAAIFTGSSQEVPWNGKKVLTSIFKEEVSHPVKTSNHNIEGDVQSDLSVHGGEYKAIYSYAREAYPYWETIRGNGVELGSFGENLVTEGLEESTICVGDQFRVGSVLLEAAQPRFPCFKLGIRFGDSGVLKQFNDSERWGIYYRILEDGEMVRGDEILPVKTHDLRLSVYDLYRLSTQQLPKSEAILRKMLDHDTLEPAWQKKAEKWLSAL